MSDFVSDKEKEVQDMTSDMRKDNFKIAPEPAQAPKHSFVKPTLEVPNTAKPMTAADIIELSKQIEESIRKQIKEAKFDSSKPGQVLKKEVVPITDFSKITLADVYDLSVPIEAKAFMSADVLSIKLKDTNYEARWVNKNPQRLGDLIAKGFTYIAPSDLISSNSIETTVDAEGHYCFNDVVAMKIDKATYYRALRAAHERAISTTDQATARKRATNTANNYMERSEFSNDYGSAQTEGKMRFYDPGVEV